MPVAIYAASVGGSVAFEYGYHRLQGKRATTKQLVMAAAFGALPLAKLRVLKSPYRYAKWHAYKHSDDLRHLVPAGTRLIRNEVKGNMGRLAPYVGGYYITKPIIDYGTGKLKRTLFSHGYDIVVGTKPKTRKFTPGGRPASGY